MMKTIYRLGLPCLLLSTTLYVYADDTNSGDDGSGQQISNNTMNLSTYLLNLGADLGYDLTAKTPPTPPVSPLLPLTSTQLLGTGNQLPFFTNVFDAFLGAVPVNALFMQFVPASTGASSSAYSAINSLANATFPSYGSSTTATNGISASPAIDQLPFQQDPVSQAVLNILGTPSYTYCMNNDASLWTGGPSTTAGGAASPYPKCNLLNQNEVMNNIVGTLPSPQEYYTATYNQQFLSQLNGNTLISPLLYSTTTSGPSTSSSPPTPTGNTSLPAQSQEQQAANFIRYATGSVAPLSLPKLQDYNTLYTQAMNPSSPPNLPAQIQAQSALTSYFTRLRVFAAQTSVGYSNLYYILSKRMPQPNLTPATSQALNEFTMASWRLYTPGGTANTNWLNEINNAPLATVQKEMVTLLAEINYQLYLTRQQEERMLLTNTMLLLLSARSTQPTPPTAANNAP